MTAKNLTALGLASVLSLGSVAAVSSVQAPAQAQTEVQVQKSGTFVGAGRKSVSGAAHIFSYQGKRYLFLDQAFQSGQGPDLFVLLHKQAEPKSYRRSNYRSVGRLQKLSGKQWYEIPAGVNLDEAKSVVVWCRQFNVTFGFAKLDR